MITTIAQVAKWAVDTIEIACARWHVGNTSATRTHTSAPRLRLYEAVKLYRPNNAHHRPSVPNPRTPPVVSMAVLISRTPRPAAREAVERRATVQNAKFDGTGTVHQYSHTVRDRDSERFARYLFGRERDVVVDINGTLWDYPESRGIPRDFHNAQKPPAKPHKYYNECKQNASTVSETYAAEKANYQ